MDDELKKNILNKIIEINKFLRQIQEYCQENNIEYHQEKIYISLMSKKNILKELIDKE